MENLYHFHGRSSLKLCFFVSQREEDQLVKNGGLKCRGGCSLVRPPLLLAIAHYTFWNNLEGRPETGNLLWTVYVDRSRWHHLRPPRPRLPHYHRRPNCRCRYCCLCLYPRHLNGHALYL
jgi:hypothetical protein